MRRCLSLAIGALLLVAPLVPRAATKQDAEIVSRVFDLHCDTVYQGVTKGWDLKKNKGAVDLGKLERGAYIAQVFALWTPPMGGWAYLTKLHAKFEEWMGKYRDEIALATTADEILALDSKGKVAAVLGVEGLAPLKGDVSKIAVLHSWGVRILTLTWWYSTEFAGSSTDPDETKRTGLSDRGREAVALANQLGMIIDVSHASDAVVREVAELSADPFIASHSCAGALKDHPRNLSDDLLKLIADHEGVVGLNFHTGFLADVPGESVRRSVAVTHILHMVTVMGADHVALGSDFDGSHPPIGLKHGVHMQLLARDLMDAGLSQDDVDKIMYANALRLFARVAGNGPAPEPLARLAHPGGMT